MESLVKTRGKTGGQFGDNSLAMRSEIGFKPPFKNSMSSSVWFGKREEN